MAFFSGTLRQGSWNTSQKKMFEDLKNNIYHPVYAIFGGINGNGGFNPKPLKLRDFNVLSVNEHAQIVWKLQRQFRKGKHQLLQAEFVLCTGLSHLNSYSIDCI